MEELTDELRRRIIAAASELERLVVFAFLGGRGGGSLAFGGVDAFVEVAVVAVGPEIVASVSPYLAGSLAGGSIGGGCVLGMIVDFEDDFSPVSRINGHDSKYNPAK